MANGYTGEILRVNIDEEGVELFKTHFYRLEGWDVKTGWPTRKTLEELSLRNVADILGSKGKLGVSPGFPKTKKQATNFTNFHG